MSLSKFRCPLCKQGFETEYDTIEHSRRAHSGKEVVPIRIKRVTTNVFNDQGKHRVGTYRRTASDAVMSLRLEEGSYKRFLGEVKRAFVIRVLRECGNSQVKAAKVLGIARNNLRAIMENNDIEHTQDIKVEGKPIKGV